MSSPTAQQHYDEVLGALSAHAAETGISPERGELVRADRRSEFEYFGLRTTDRRRRGAAGFSFTDQDAASVLVAWDEIWNLAANGDVMFAALDFYRRRMGARSWTTTDSAAFWGTAVGWIDRIDNWAHADDLARLYSFALADQPERVYPVLDEWSRSDSEWHRRIAMVSLIHYSGKNAVFLPIDPCLRLLANCVDDRRKTVSSALGWVLRELLAMHPDAVLAFLKTHASSMPPPAIRRATERLPQPERDHVRASLA
ncbi:DNA alkylation repair protein [Salinibacterium sp. SWN167]|uniref:DNA alkylation repair protein n=1 Tax=Salinibacterium sp. SWN167 TaxID=2792054 RepID=UPI0018CD39E3|nr:DNA alkylation repair protein [Salinibacterium sp. SWN167]MBH0082157.1 DNA alkylation repair protein [Salinibacterium sp. SWN167]